MSSTLFQQLLGAPFFRLPASVRALHSGHGRSRYAGSATITRGRNPIGRLCAAVARLPPAGIDVPIVVELQADARGETWQRHFGKHRMQSRLQVRDKLLHERLGLLQFRFALHVHDGALWWQTAGVRLFGLLPLPASWFAEVRCREREHEGRYEFMVEAALPLAGRLIRYEGWLEPA
ncbi:uncharacterized protein DUF4166 [Luteimonas cucumeris]|uniref:Uncharacterized protein DUF4166 n=1 Tax=Luteimonas cucumeris TaxID=985012 RepID=A0A562L5F2_9GAMM|nr:DUF4166 domain-containing protein [Luteimonas cucumeris]TWI02868.1 uncharacterized protein DUF4166 [Luteimonas cucumeris]